MSCYLIGIIPYINMEPYRQLGEPKYCKFESLLPRDSVEQIKKGRICAAAIPVGGLSSISELVQPLGQFGIAAKERSMSVLFFSKVPFEMLNQRHKIKLTSESASSVKLLYLLLGCKNGFENMPEFSLNESVPDGELIIGDRALSQCESESSNLLLDENAIWPYVTDLAQLWYETKGFPFVFARWVIRNDAPKMVRNSIYEWLLEFKSREEELVDKSIKFSSKMLKLSNSDVRLYFKVIRRILDSDDLLGQEIFMDLLKKHCRDSFFEKL